MPVTQDSEPKSHPSFSATTTVKTKYQGTNMFFFLERGEGCLGQEDPWLSLDPSGWLGPLSDVPRHRETKLDLDAGRTSLLSCSAKSPSSSRN